MDGETGATKLSHSKDALQRLADQLRGSLKCWRPKPLLHRRKSGRYEHVWLLCWILKDLGWALLCGFVAWPAALAGLALQAQDVFQQWESAPLAEWVHSLAILGWLSGSCVWMTAQLLFEPDIHKSRTAPWYSGSIFAGNADHYHWGVYLTQAIHMATLLGLKIFYTKSLSDAGVVSGVIATLKGSSSKQPTWDIIRERKASLCKEADTSASTSTGTPNSQVLVFGMMTPEVYSKIFIVPWILKDLFWCHRSFIPAILCIFLVTVLMADYLWLFKKWKNLAMLLWATGSAVWLSNDLVMHEQEIWPLLLSILSFLVGICILFGALIFRPNSEDPCEIDIGDERDPLL